MYLCEIFIVDQLTILKAVVDYSLMPVNIFRMFGVHKKRSRYLPIEAKCNPNHLTLYSTENAAWFFA